MLSSPPEAKEDAMEPKALDDGTIQRAAVDKSRNADYASQTSISQQSAPNIATEAEARVADHQPPSPVLLIFRHQVNSQQVPAETTMLQPAHTPPSTEAIVLKSRTTRRHGETCVQINS